MSNSSYKYMQRKQGATLWDVEERPVIEMGMKERMSNSSALNLSDSFHAHVSERMEKHNADTHSRRKLLSLDFPGCLIELDQTLNRDELKEVHRGLTISKELLQVLSGVWNVEEQKATCLSLFSAINTELDRSCNQLSKLMHKHRYHHGEVDILLNKFEEEKAMRKIKEREKIHMAITTVAAELKMEKKLRKQTERLNRKLGKELADTRASVLKKTREVEGERRAREILEQVCDDLARGVGEDRAEVEDLKKESAKIREEVEMERKMLQLADVLREERVQMKLSEAKYQFEEKNAVVDQLRTELEAYLAFKNGHKQDSSNKDEDDDDDDSADSDLHSIELNMDDSSEWCRLDPIRFSVSDNIKGRKSIPRQSISTEWATGEKENVNTLGNFLKNGGISKACKKDHEEETERYKMIKDLRDHFLSASTLYKSKQQGDIM